MRQTIHGGQSIHKIFVTKISYFDSQGNLVSHDNFSQTTITGV